MAVNPYGRTSKRGVVLNWRTVEMLEITELRELRDLTPLPLSQGSYTTVAPQSAGTHAGGGALDVRLRDISSTQWNSIVAALRRTGFAAWLRRPSQGNWPYHIHAIAIGDHELSAAARQQVAWYKQGLNGLWPPSQGPDDGPRVRWTQYRQDIDLSYYGPERWDSRDFNRLFAKWLDVSAGSLTRPDTGDVINPDVAQCLRAAYWVRTRLTDAGLDDVARQLYTADNIIRNVGVDPEVDPQAAFWSLATFISGIENTQDQDHQSLETVKTDVAAIKAKLGAGSPPPAAQQE